MTQQKTIFITGASSGIGYATALRCAQEKHRILICARREDRLKELADEINHRHKAEVHYFCLDVSQKKEVQNQISHLPKDWQEIDVLINNAGLALGLETVDQGQIEDWEKMIDVNIKGLLYVTQAVVKGMLKRNRGHIINIGSISGREVYSGAAVYCATKHAVRALTEGMKKDWHGKAIRLTEIEPGIVETEFSKVRFKQNNSKASEVYKNTHALSAEDIADVIYFALSRPEHVDIREIFITPTSQSGAQMIARNEA